jgi:GcrA cell cycle regulator
MSAPPPTWTPDRIEQLTRLFDAGLTCSQIAREIDVSRNAVIGKISRLGLSRPKGDTGNRRQSDPHARARQNQVRVLRRILRAAAEPSAKEAEISDGQRCSLFELSPQNCRWPIGSPGADDFGFCGNEPAAGLPYCPGHARMAYQSTARRAIRR